MRRFERIHEVVEPIEEYRAGGYHPVHLEDYFHQRYRIIAKWAYGQFSIVWLAEDIGLLRTHVTLKILKSDVSANSQEVGVLLHLARTSTHHPAKSHVLQLFDHFEHKGPNGSHICLVFPFMMSDGEAMTIRERPHCLGYVREISRQIVLDLSFIDGQGLIHGDLQPANLLFTLNCYFSRQSIMEPEFSPVKWLPGVQPDGSAPRYLMASQRPRGLLDDADFSELIVKIGDLGGATWNACDNSLSATPFGLRAPELLRPYSWNEKADTWATGCLIFQLATNEPLSPIESFALTSDKMYATLRTLMHELFKNGNEGFAVHIGERLPAEFGTENTEHLAQFLWSMLQEHPENRKSAEELLNHSFLA